MKEHIIDFKDLTDSREMLDKKVPNFMVWFIYIIFTLAITALIWSWFSEMDMVIKASGVVRPDKNISIVTNVNEGKLEKILYKEGEMVKKGELLYRIDDTSYELQKETLMNRKNRAKDKLEKLKKLEKSVNQDENLFSKKGREFYNRYMSYKLKSEQLKLDLEQAQTRYLQEKSLGLDFTTKSKLNELKTKESYARMNLEKHKSETLFSIKSEILDKEKEILELDNKIEEISEKIELGKVRSPITGTIQLINDYNKGDYIRAGAKMLRVIPKGTDLKMEMKISNKDIGQIETGQKVKFRLLAFPYEDYGTIEGKVLSIPKDITYGEKNTNLVYKVDATIPERVLYNRKGKKGLVKIGMASEVRVISRRRKIFYIILDKLDFIDLD